MTPLYNKKFAIFFISTIAILGFGFNIYSNIDNQTAVNTQDYSDSRIVISKDSGFTSEQRLRNKTGREEKQNRSFLTASQNSHDTQSTDSDRSSQREQALAREEELANQQKCHDSNIDEVGYVTEAYNQNNIDSTTANQQILYQMQSCNRQQIGDIVKKIFSDSDDKTHAMALLLDLLPQMPRSLSIINAIKQQHFSNEDMQSLIDLTKDQPTGVKQALVPSIVKNDNLDNFLALTEQNNFFSSLQQRSGSYPTNEQASNMIQGMILSQRHNIQPEGEIYNHLLNAYPSSETQNALTKIAFTTNQ